MSSSSTVHENPKHKINSQTYKSYISHTVQIILPSIYASASMRTRTVILENIATLLYFHPVFLYDRPVEYKLVLPDAWLRNNFVSSFWAFFILSICAYMCSGYKVNRACISTMFEQWIIDNKRVDPTEGRRSAASEYSSAV